ncbi:MAG: ABC transporter ATP-binding protein [Coriobacteriia bacterium]|jgi:lipoprotein-releasing system ATP-binding protein|nr:ABC transporter ATP-binding protein [Coriobacteriia bacterium]
MGDVILELDRVVKSYGERVITEVIHGVDLRVGAEDFLALIGPSGSGKSTLLNLMGLLDRPTKGRVIVRGVDTTGMDDGQRTRLRGRSIGFVFQFHHLLPAFTALENVVLPMWSDKGVLTPSMRQRARALLERIGLGPQMNNKATDLSGGQQQRVAIARALAMRPALVLADEPTGNLDTQTADQIFELLREFGREEGSALVIVTHDSRIADRCDRVVQVVDGRIVLDERRLPKDD